MKPAARKPTLIPAVVWLAVLCVVAATSAPRAAAAAVSQPTAATNPAAPAPATTAPSRGMSRDLLALGTEERFWSADVIPFVLGKASGTKTHIRVRGAGDPQWRLVSEIEAPAVSLAHRGNELLVVLENGDWMIVSDTGMRSGTPLPDGGDVLAMAGDGDDVWAVGLAPPGVSTVTVKVTPATAAAATSPTTAASRPVPVVVGGAATTTAATSPATSPAPPAPPAPAHPLGLYLLSRGDWSRRDALPAGIERADLAAVSLAALDGRLMLAVADRDGAVRVFTHRPGGGWDKGVDVTVAPAAQARLRLLDLRGRPALWVSDLTGPGALFFDGEKRWQGPTRLAPSPKLQAFDRTALATALGQLRLLASDGKQRLAEQIYNLDGTLSGPATEAVTIAPVDNRVAQLIQMFVVAVLFVWMMGALRQRPETQEAARRVDQLNLAPVSRRILGGAIDLLPVLIGLLVATQSAPLPPPGTPEAATVTYASPQIAWLAAGIGLYLLHTTVTELLFARSIGKFLTGTRVAALDGTRPAVLALLTRNLLRIVDIVLVFPPIFVFFSPLRQRIGDMAAGTLVVMDAPTEPLTSGDVAAAGDADTSVSTLRPPAPPPPPPPASDD